MIFNGTSQKCLKQNSTCPGKTTLAFTFLSIKLNSTRLLFNLFPLKMVSTKSTLDLTIKFLLGYRSADCAIRVAQSAHNTDSMKAFVPSARNTDVENNAKTNAEKISTQTKTQRLVSHVTMSARSVPDLGQTTVLTARISRSSTTMFRSRNTTTQPSLIAQHHVHHLVNSKSSPKSVREKVVHTVH